MSSTGNAERAVSDQPSAVSYTRNSSCCHYEGLETRGICRCLCGSDIPVRQDLENSAEIRLVCLLSKECLSNQPRTLRSNSCGATHSEDVIRKVAAAGSPQSSASA